MKFDLRMALTWLACAVMALAVLGIIVFPIFGRIVEAVLSGIALLASAFAVGGLLDEDTRT